MPFGLPPELALWLGGLTAGLSVMFFLAFLGSAKPKARR